MNADEITNYLKKYNEWRRFNGAMKDSPEQPNPKELGKVIEAAIKLIQPAAHEFKTGTKFTRRKGKHKKIETIVDFNTTRNLRGDIVSSEYICQQEAYGGQLVLDTALHSTLKLSDILET